MLVLLFLFFFGAVTVEPVCSSSSGVTFWFLDSHVSANLYLDKFVLSCIYFSLSSFFYFSFSGHSLFCLSLHISLWPPPIPRFPTPHPTTPLQTFLITRTITILAKLSMKGMIFLQWPMPWQGWVPPPLSPPCPVVLDPLTVYMTASCSALGVKRPLRGLRWLSKYNVPAYIHEGLHIRTISYKSSPDSFGISLYPQMCHMCITVIDKRLANMTHKYSEYIISNLSKAKISKASV